MLNPECAGPCDFLRECIQTIKSKHPRLSSIQISKKLGIPPSTLGRIENLEVKKPTFKHALTIIRAAYPEEKNIYKLIRKYYPEIQHTFDKTYSGNEEVNFVQPDAQEFFKDQKTYEFMMMATSSEGISEEVILEQYGIKGLQIIQDLINKGILKKQEDRIRLGNGPVNAEQDTVQKLLQNLVNLNYDVDAFGEKDNWLTLQYGSVDKDYVMPRLVEILRNANQEIRELFNSPVAKGKDIVWAGLSMDSLDKQDQGTGGNLQ